VIIAAGIDLAVGSVLVFSSVVSAQVMQSIGGNSVSIDLVGLAVAVAAGLAWGLVNGLLVARLKLSPLIVTLATLGAALGLAQIITTGVDLRDVPLSLINSIGNGRVWGISWLTIIAAGVTIIGGLVLHFTKFGRHTYIIGSNAVAARDAGIGVTGHLIRVYGLMGLLAGLAGFLSLARFGTTEIGGHSTDNLQVITAVILGGTSLFGGSGSVLGTLIGAFIPAVMLTGFVIVGVQSFWQEVAVGVILVIAVLVDRIRRRQRE
jgi:ribose transport system permease protein